MTVISVGSAETKEVSVRRADTKEEIYVVEVLTGRTEVSIYLNPESARKLVNGMSNLLLKREGVS